MLGVFLEILLQLLLLLLLFAVDVNVRKRIQKRKGEPATITAVVTGAEMPASVLQKLVWAFVRLLIQSFRSQAW